MSSNAELILLIDKENLCLSDLLRQVDLLRNRFNFEISVFFSDPSTFYLEYKDALEKAGVQINRIGISDKANYIADLLEFCKRFDKSKIIVKELRIDESKFLLNLMRDLVLGGNVVSKEHYTNENSLFTITSEAIRRKKVLNFSFFNELLSYIETPRSVDTISENIEDPSSSNLFLTAKFVERVGGIDSVLTENEIYVGENPICKYSNLWILSERHSSVQIKKINPTVNVFYVPTNLRINELDYIIDINPAFLSTLQTSNNAQLRVPRLFLSARKAPVWPISHESKRCTFVMSNYNKADYVASALFSIFLQQYEKISISFVDDNSSDNSIDIAVRMRAKLSDKSIDFSIRRNSKNRGTYWIRNSSINQCISRGSFYFVNDSDDFSSSYRAAIQATIIDKNEKAEEAHINFGDIVRVSSNFEILPLDLKVERYGTASLAASACVHSVAGYYENIMKNADTEFIERLRHFFGKSSAKWFRYPVLWQPFDGNNLTSDIYQKNNEGQLAQKLTKRDIHREIFAKMHKNLSKGELSTVYSYPNFSYSKEYKAKLADFLIKDIL